MSVKLIVLITICLGGLCCSAFGETAEKPETTATLTVETVVCTSVEERQPVGESSAFPNDVNRVYLWCKVTGMTDTTTINHVWYLDGKEKANVELTIKNSVWRTWSYKTIPPEWDGNWEVKVLDKDGTILTSKKFTVAK